MNEPIFQSAPVIRKTLNMLDSYRDWIGSELVDRSGSEMDQARRLYESPAVVLCHDGGTDPTFVYANASAQSLFEFSWDEFLKLRSRQSAEPELQPERAEMLRRAAKDGFIQDYSGIRIRASGQRFFIQQATIWNVMGTSGQCIGQAAAFSQWNHL